VQSKVDFPGQSCAKTDGGKIVGSQKAVLSPADRPALWASLWFLFSRMSLYLSVG
jgi:hypothetical protein